MGENQENPAVESPVAETSDTEGPAVETSGTEGPVEGSPAKENPLTSSLAAVRELQQAKRAHSDARKALSVIEDKVNTTSATLEHRQSIEQNYDSILSEQGAVVADAKSQMASLASQLDANASEIQGLQADLENLKATHAQEIAPLRDLSDAANERAERDKKELNNARREVRNADRHLDDLTRARQERMRQAEDAQRGAEQQLSMLQDRLYSLNGDPSGNADQIAEIQREIAAQQSQRDQAVADAQRLPSQFDADIEQARAALARANDMAKAASKALDASEAEAKQRAAKYREVKRGHKDAETAAENHIIDLQHKGRDLKATHDGHNERLQAAQAAIDEAESIHATPEQTQALADDLAKTQALAESQRQRIERLAQAEAEVRERTRNSRIKFWIAVAIVVAIIVAICYWLFFAFVVDPARGTL